MTQAATQLPPQGSWTEAEYLALNANRRLEFANGYIEVLGVPTRTHELILAFLYNLLRTFIAGRGRVYFAGYRLRIPSGKYREPDLLYLTAEQDAAAGEDFTVSANLAMEVVSADDPQRDYVTKRREHADAGVPEYWIVDPAQKVILVLRLEDGQYIEHGRFVPGQMATSHLLPGFAVAVDDVLPQGQ